MFNRLKNLYENIKNINKSVNDYKNESIIQSLPTVANVNRAKKLIEAKQYDKAVEVLKDAIDISDKDPLVYKYLGKISEMQKDFIQASKYYERSALLNGDDKEIWLRLGMSYLYSDVLDKAIKCFERADKINPNNTDIHTGWGMAYMKQKKYALARDKFNTASKISKYNFTAILLSAVMEIRLKEYAIADEKLSFLVKVAPNEGSLYEYSHLRLIQGNLKEAELYAKRTLDVNRFMMPAYLLLGEIYSLQNDEERTNQVFVDAVDKKLENTVLHFEWGKALIRLLDFEKAEEHFKFALGLDESNDDAKIGLALTEAYKGNFTIFEELKEKYASNVYIQEAFGLKEMLNGNYETAIEYFNKSLKTDPHQTYLYYHLACSNIHLKNNYKVREYFEKFIKENPKYVKGYVEYSKWLMEMSDFDEAKRKLTKAQNLAPNDIEILNLLFYTHYTLVKKNICEYNIKVAISIAQQAQDLGHFEYTPQKQELEEMLKELQIMS